LDTIAKPVTHAQSAGSLFKEPAGGRLSSLVSLDRAGPGTPSNAKPIMINLDGLATTAVLRREAAQAIADKPRAAQAAAISATGANAGRRQPLTLQLSPGTLTN
jgi:hypothetical protein